jgi:hypothetical protein
MEKRRSLEIELLKAIAEQKHIRVGVPNHSQPEKLFFYYGFPVNSYVDLVDRKKSSFLGIKIVMGDQ